MKTIGNTDQVARIVESDPVAVANLRALARNQAACTVPVTTASGRIIMAIDPVIYGNVRDTIIRLALRRYYKPGGNR